MEIEGSNGPVVFRWLTAALLMAALRAGAVAELQPPGNDTGKHLIAREEAMGTELEFRLYPADADTSLEEMRYFSSQAYAAVHGLEERISTWRPNSFTSAINRHAAESPVETSQEIIRLLLDVRRIWETTEGAFDPTVGPLLALWGFYKKQGHLPDAAELKQACEKVGLSKVTIDPAAKTVAFAAEGMRLDFGGIGKGLALDYAAQALKEHGVTRGVLHAGSSTIVALDPPVGVDGWTVRIRPAYNDSGNSHLDEVTISNESLSTSTGAEQFFDLDGKRYAHIFDPRTGKPVEGVLSATAIAPTGAQSDALSTAFFVMGLEKTRAYCRVHPAIRAILVVDRDGAPQPVRINFPEDEERS